MSAPPRQGREASLGDEVDERVLAIRARVLPLLRDRATITRAGRSGIVVWRPGAFRFELRLATADWPPPLSMPTYSKPLAEKIAPTVLPYGLDIWSSEKVMSVDWATDGAFRVFAFKHGDWERAIWSLR